MVCKGSVLATVSFNTPWLSLAAGRASCLGCDDRPAGDRRLWPVVNRLDGPLIPFRLGPGDEGCAAHCGPSPRQRELGGTILSYKTDPHVHP